MKKFFLKFICLTIIFSLLLSSSPFPAFGKCDSGDNECKLKKQAERGCRDADNVDGCRMERKTAQDKIEDIQRQKQAGMAPAVSPEETDPQKAGDLVWGKCKEAGGNDDSCKAQAQEAFLKVEKEHPVDPATKEQYIVRDALRTTALKEVGGSENLSYEQAERIRQQSDLAAAPVLKDEYGQDFVKAMEQKLGHTFTKAELSELTKTEEFKQFASEYYQQNKGKFKSAISKEADLATLGKDLLNQKSVSLYLEKEAQEKEGAKKAAGAEAQKKAEEKVKQDDIAVVQQAIKEGCQSGEPVVKLSEASDYSGWYGCKTRKTISDNEASKLKKEYECKLLLSQAEAKAKIEPKGILSKEIKMGQSGGTSGISSTGPSQDSLFACTASPEKLEAIGDLLNKMAVEYKQRQLEDPFLDTDNDGYLNYLDCDPANQSYQKNCPGQTRKPSEYSVYTVTDGLQVKGILTSNGQPVMGNIVLEVFNPKTEKYEEIEAEFDRWGQFTSDQFSTFTGPMADPVLISATVTVKGQPRRVVVPINPNEDGTFSTQNIRLEDYGVGTEEELTKQINDRYGLEMRQNSNNIWTAQELGLIEETLSELPPIFWAKESFTGFSRGASGNFEKEVAGYVPESLLISAGSWAFRLGLETNEINIFNDKVLSLNQRTFPKPSTSYDQEDLFKQVLIHELTHTIQHQNPATENLRPSMPILPNAYDNQLVQSFMETVGWQEDTSTITFISPPDFILGEDGIASAPTSYAKNDPLEDMADSTMLFVANPDYLKERSPERYNWIRDNLFSGREYTSPQGNNNFFNQFVKKTSLALPKFSVLAQGSQTPTSLEKLESVKPNMSREEVLKNLGAPFKERTILDYTFLSYPSSNPQIAHVIVLQNNRVLLIDIYKGAERPEKYSEFVDKFGDPEKVTYIYFAEGAKVSIFAKEGIALITLKDNEYVIKKQIFSPLSIEEFLTTLGKNLPLSDPYNQVDTSTPNTPQNTFELKEGWNLIAFPFVPMEVWTASDLVTDVARQGGYITSVARWNNGRWEAYIQRGDQPYGQDFPLEPGVGYMLRGHLPVNWVASGFQITSSLPLSLKKGYNLVGIVSPNSYTATSTIESINTSAKEEVGRTVTRFESGLYEPLVKQKGEIYGEDYPIEKTRGYFIRVDKEVNWTP